MPRDGSRILSDLQSPTVSIVCEPCGRRERYAVAKLIDERGAEAKLTDLVWDLVDCPKSRSTNIHDRCKAVYGKPRA
jgi:RNase P subunit RPR2